MHRYPGPELCIRSDMGHIDYCPDLATSMSRYPGQQSSLPKMQPVSPAKWKSSNYPTCGKLTQHHGRQIRFPPTLPNVTGFGASWLALLKIELWPPQNCDGLRTKEFEPPNT